MGSKVLSQTPTNVVELKAELERIKKRDKEFSFRAGKAYEYLQEFVQLTQKQAEELMAKLAKLGVPRLRDQHFHKLLDIMPTTANDVKVALQGYNITVSQENCKKIASVLTEYAKKEEAKKEVKAEAKEEAKEKAKEAAEKK